MSDQKNLFLALVLSLAILVSFDYLLPKPPAPMQESPRQEAKQTDLTPSPDGRLPSPEPSVAYVTRDEALKNTPRIRIETPSLSGSLSLRGSQIDDLTLKNYRVHVDPTSPISRCCTPRDLQRPTMLNLDGSPPL